jgi:hypothetical protein
MNITSKKIFVTSNYLDIYQRPIESDVSAGLFTSSITERYYLSSFIASSYPAKTNAVISIYVFIYF